jgi:hypothetical protein
MWPVEARKPADSAHFALGKQLPAFHNGAQAKVERDRELPAALPAGESKPQPVANNREHDCTGDFDNVAIVGHCDRSPDAEVFGAGTRIVNGLNHTCDAQVTA